MPKRHHPGELKRGDSVWYHGDRFYVEYAPDNWQKGVFARICSIPVRDNVTPQEFEHVKNQAKAESFCCHIDMLTSAPVTKSVYGKQPTQLALERKEQTKRTGLHDIGDDVAEMLRGKDPYKAAAEYLNVPVAELKTKYAHLNAGQQRMNLGNRMRAKWKKLNSAA